jgi:hypothetical protein
MNFVSDPSLKVPENREDRFEKSSPTEKLKDLINRSDGKQDQGTVEDRDVGIDRIQSSLDFTFRIGASGSGFRNFRNEEIVDTELADSDIIGFADCVA